MTAPEALHSSKSVEWYTPATFVEAARTVLGGIDLDPASCEAANQVIKADRFFDERINGLDHPWRGRVFLSPPYGRIGGKSSQAVWSQYLINEYRSQRVTAAVLLVNAATGNQWFEPLWEFSVCLTRRIRFWRPGGKPRKPTHGNALVYLGPDHTLFATVFSRLGVVIPVGMAIRRRPDKGADEKLARIHAKAGQ